MSDGDHGEVAAGAGGDSAEADADADLATLIEAYLDGSLDGGQANRLAALISAPGDGARKVRTALAMAGLVIQALDRTSAEDVVRGVDVRLQAEHDASEFVRTVRRALPMSSPGARPWRLVFGIGSGIAAAIAVAVLLLQAHSAARPAAAAPTTPVVASFRPRAGGAAEPMDGSELVRADGRIVLGPGEQGTLVFADEPTVFALTGADLHILHGPPGASCYLARGELTATVAHQQPGAPLVIATPHASAVVVGTRFAIAASAQRTRITVLEGAVQMRDLHGATTRVDAGARVELPEDPAARDDQAPIAGALPAAPEWSPLFPGAALSGWSTSSGDWELQDGAVVGSNPAGSWSRLVSTRDLGDFVMTCRLRILGMNYAEIQLLDYKWFVSINPEQPGTWQSLAVQVREGVVTAWCDGRPAKVHPGIDTPRVRFGPLCFYERPGGRLEIRDARFRETDLPLPSMLPSLLPSPLPSSN